MLSVELFLAFGLLCIVLFFGGLYLCYEGHSLALLAPISSVIVMWGLTLLSAFGRVGSTSHIFDGSTIQTITTACDPAVGYIMAFLSIGLTFALIIYVGQFAAEVASRNSEIEEVEE